MQLYRLDSGSSWGMFKNVFIVGNGAIEGGNVPIHQWVEDSRARNHASFMEVPWYTGEDLASAWMSNYLRLLRKYPKGRPNGPEFDSLDPEAIPQYRKKLGDLFTKAANLSLRKLPDHLTNVLYSSETLVLSVNWDLVLWNNDRLKNLIQLHGICLQPESMIFPTEYLVDHIFEGTRPYDIPIDVINNLGVVHDHAITAIRSCSKIFFWGIALHAYDSEVMALVSQASNSPKDVIVINISEQAAYRAGALVQATELRHYHPDKNFSCSLWEVRRGKNGGVHVSKRCLKMRD